jgi:hypothetical protein
MNDDDERGYSPEEIERGDDRAWHIPVPGCILFLLVLVTLAVIIWRAIATGTDF